MGLKKVKEENVRILKINIKR